MPRPGHRADRIGENERRIGRGKVGALQARAEMAEADRVETRERSPPRTTE